jgi:hypothetical protein
MPKRSHLCPAAFHKQLLLAPEAAGGLHKCIKSSCADLCARPKCNCIDSQISKVFVYLFVLAASSSPPPPCSRAGRSSDAADSPEAGGSSGGAAARRQQQLVSGGPKFCGECRSGGGAFDLQAKDRAACTDY